MVSADYASTANSSLQQSISVVCEDDGCLEDSNKGDRIQYQEGEMVTNLSQVTVMATIWKRPIQESNLKSTKSAMALVHHSPAPAPLQERLAHPRS